MTKVIFATRKEIEDCYRKVMARQAGARAYQKAQAAKEAANIFKNMQSEGKDAGYFKLADMRDALFGKPKSDTRFNLSVSPQGLKSVLAIHKFDKDNKVNREHFREHFTVQVHA